MDERGQYKSPARGGEEREHVGEAFANVENRGEGES
jgi:hypothetical protein